MATRDNTLNSCRRLVRFGAFELDLDSGELRKHGIRIKLQSQPFQILKALVEQPGTIITREELRSRLWPQQTFVDFENGLNTAINRARLALGDSSDNPRYIETLARTGYRFVAPIEHVQWSADAVPVPVVEHVPVPDQKKKPAPRARWAVAALVVTAACITYVAWSRNPSPEPMMRQITFRRGIVGGARFTPGGDAILYTAKWENEPRATFLIDPVSPESRLLSVSEANIASVSPEGHLALLTFSGTMNIGGGILSRVPMNGGTPLQVDSNIMSADWSAEDDKLAVVRAVRGASQLEFPIGSVLYRTAGWLSGVRVSRQGGGLAFIDHPVRHDDAGSVMFIEPSGKVRTLASGWSNVAGLAWHPTTKEVWFTAARKGGLRSLWASSIDGKLRPIAQSPGILTLRDISPSGRVLISRDSRRLEMAARGPDDARERDLSFLDWSRVQSISADGSLVLFDESGEAAGSQGVIYVTRTKDKSTIRVGDGAAMGLSPDGTQVLALDTASRDRLWLLSLDGTVPRTLASTGIRYQWARFFPDGKRLLVLGNKPDTALSLYVQPMDGGTHPVPIASESMVRNTAISPDGEQVAVLSPEGKLMLYSTNGNPAQIIPTDEPLAPVHWSRDGQCLYVQHMRSYTALPARVSKMHLPSGRIEHWRDLAPEDRIGVHSVTGVVISADERSYVYSYRRFLSELYVTDGWR